MLFEVYEQVQKSQRKKILVLLQKMTSVPVRTWHQCRKQTRHKIFVTDDPFSSVPGPNPAQMYLEVPRQNLDRLICVGYSLNQALMWAYLCWVFVDLTLIWVHLCRVWAKPGNDKTEPNSKFRLKNIFGYSYHLYSCIYKAPTTNIYFCKLYIIFVIARIQTQDISPTNIFPYQLTCISILLANEYFFSFEPS